MTGNAPSAFARQQPQDKNKLYAMHAPEVECIGKGKARKPYEFGVKASLAVTHKHGLMVGARTFPGNPYDGHILAAQLEQTDMLLQDIGVTPKHAIVDLGFRGVDADNRAGADHPSRQVQVAGPAATTLAQTAPGDRAGDRAPEVGSPHGPLLVAGASAMRCMRVLCAAGYNIRWLLRAIARPGLEVLFCAFIVVALDAALTARAMSSPPSRLRFASTCG